MTLRCPEGWNFVKLSDLGEVNRGRSRHRPRHSPHLYGGSYPFIQTGDIKSSGGRITTFQQTYSEAGLRQSRLWPAETLCITIAANIAETGILKFSACFPDSVIGFIADPEQCDVYFIEYMFRHIRRLIQHAARESGTVQDNINLGTFERLRFPIPKDVHEQKAISHILGALDDKIDLNRQMNYALEEAGLAIFRSWLVDFDPVVAKASGRSPFGMSAETAALFPVSFVESAMGLIPDRWQWKPVDKIANFLNGLALQKYPPNGDGDLSVIKIAEMNRGITDSSGWANSSVPQKYIINDGDVLFSWSGTLDICLWCGGSGALNQHLFKVTSSDYSKWFYYFWLREHLPEFQAIASDKVTTMGHIQRHHLSRAFVVVPSDEVMKRLDRVEAPLVQRVIHNNLEARALAELRDALLPKLLSGEIRIGQAEKVVAEAV